MEHEWAMVPLAYKTSHTNMHGMYACVHCGRWEELVPKRETCESFRDALGNHYAWKGMHDPFAGYRDVTSGKLMSSYPRTSGNEFYINDPYQTKEDIPGLTPETIDREAYDDFGKMFR